MPSDSLHDGRRRSLSSIFLGISNIGETLFPLVRGVALAHLLAPEQFGLAISVTMVASVAELISELGVSQLALRYGSGANLATLHSLAILRGIALGAVIALLGPVFSFVFSSPETKWIYSLAGLASVLRGFSHLDSKAQMKSYLYSSEASASLFAQTLWTIISIVAAYYLRDYRSMIIGLVASSMGYVIISHVTATTAFRLAWDRDVVKEARNYGKPLVLNGMAFSVASLGDRFLIGARIGLDSLAQYTALSSAAFLPRSAIAKFMTSLFTPQFVNIKSSGEYQVVADSWLICLAALGGTFGLAFMAAGHEAVSLVFGHKYVIPQEVITLAAILATVRYIAIVPVAPAMAAGRTSLILMSTLLISTGLILGSVALCVNSSLQFLLTAMTAGELFALICVLNRLQMFVPFSKPVIYFAGTIPIFFVLVFAFLLFYFPSMSLFMRVGLCAVFLSLTWFGLFILINHCHLSVTQIAQRLFPRFVHS